MNKLKHTINKLYDGKSTHINILTLKRRTKIKIYTEKNITYNLSLLDIKKSKWKITGNDKFFKTEKEVIIVGTMMENLLKTYHICEKGRLEIMYDDKVVRTEIITGIVIQTRESEL